jgi:hypothetical protein
LYHGGDFVLVMRGLGRDANWVVREMVGCIGRLVSVLWVYPRVRIRHRAMLSKLQLTRRCLMMPIIFYVKVYVCHRDV